MTSAAPTKSTPIWPRLALLAGIGAAIVTALYAALYWNGKPPLALLSGKPDKNRIDLFAEQIHGVKFDSDGKLIETLQAQRLDHYPARGQSVLVDPVLDAKGKDGRLWKITAATGILVGSNEIRLRHDVVIVDHTRTLRFESERLDYFSDKQEASTDVAVKLQRLADVTTAVGMRAFLNTNRIELLHDVNSLYTGQ